MIDIPTPHSRMRNLVAGGPQPFEDKCQVRRNLTRQEIHTIKKRVPRQQFTCHSQTRLHNNTSTLNLLVMGQMAQLMDMQSVGR
jgi:hypothetical protein